MPRQGDVAIGERPFCLGIANEDALWVSLVTRRSDEAIKVVSVDDGGDPLPTSGQVDRIVLDADF